ncbi:hypothetical protein QR90_04635 [Deinococcus radiopugnans]|uniref:Uncharacterized protein n=2 Tax=Deinococcus radiopugnans TaxID=57497 RepID=A0A0A7KH23_9DEIO|nr:hypothetical protein [Deinococcus radiopugnans]AIZ44534.1 hypothetical protein QR90_04635 [Deinococcus radiopugnans]MBB6016171.1 hypothetical protein [Deinococcus radiopugnans ATCC 19172]QLG10158.1 hypothetical protein HLB42_04775 [Deinococcus sp. D7000]TNM72191.1 hypothetical protein FHR04_05030 [Deinococcus radiopugnans ATCC 19172]
MRRRPSFPPAAALLLAPGLLLSGCARTTDTFKPRISISSAVGVSREKSVLVDGYALDDTGVTQITVDGKPIPILPGSRKLARFQFKTLIEGTQGKYTIAARDAAGNESTLVLPISVDTVKPTIQVTRFEKSGNTIRVSGVAGDEGGVAQVLVDGNRLNITPGPRVEFFAETTGIWADIVVIDTAGNQATLRAR